jgi:CO/xanthine dehydrogenase Mo-binding subunit
MHRVFTGATDVFAQLLERSVGARMVNATLLEGQIRDAIAQGVGQALMEEFILGLTETFDDYLISTLQNIPPIDVIAVEDSSDSSSVESFGAIRFGESALVPTASAIFDAIGVCPYRAPVTLDVVKAIRSKHDDRSGRSRDVLVTELRG